MEQNKRFKMIDESFICENCNELVPKLNYTARNHCPFCLHSKHVDILPGDRLNPCKGMLKPIGIEQHRQTFKIIFKCLKCNKIKKNIVATDDNMDLIIKLSKNTLN